MSVDGKDDVLAIADCARISSIYAGAPLSTICTSWPVSSRFKLSFRTLRDFSTDALGAITTTWLARLLTPCILALSAPLAGLSLKLPTGHVWWYIAAIGIMDTVAFVAYNTGLIVGQVSIVSVISSLYSAVTVVLAWIVLRERLQQSQWLGVGVVFAGIVLVNI